jgi:single-strand DNA-binding protein
MKETFMKGMNRVFLMGRLGSNPELLVSKNGKNFTKISLAVSRRQRAENGEYENKTDWHRVMVWGKTAQNCCDHLQKGSPIAVEGSLTQVKYVDPVKGDVFHTHVTADEVIFLPKSERNIGSQPNLAQGIQ